MNYETTKAMACSNCGRHRAHYADGPRECFDCGFVIDWPMVGSGTLTLQTMATGIGRAPTADCAMDGDEFQRAQAETLYYKRLLEETRSLLPRTDEYACRTLPDAVKRLVAEKDRLLHEARAESAPLDVENLHIDPESVIILRAYRISPSEAIERAKEVRDAIRRQTGHAVLVIVAGVDDSITLGRRPIGMPEHVREAYAEAAAASYGVTPDVIQRKKAERRARAVNAPPCQAKPESAPPESRPPFGSKAIGADIVPYPEPVL